MSDVIQKVQVTADVSQAQAALNDIQDSFNQTGQAIKNSMNDGTSAIKENQNVIKEHIPLIQNEEKSVSSLREAYLKHRTEIREQNFVYRELNNAIGAVALATTALDGGILGNSESMKKTTTSVKDGLVAFQGLSFALSAVPFGSLIAATVAAGIAIFELSKKTEEANPIFRTQKEIIDGIVSAYTNWTEKLHGTVDANNVISKEEADSINKRLNNYNEFYLDLKEGTLQSETDIFGVKHEWRAKDSAGEDERLEKEKAAHEEAYKIYHDAYEKMRSDGKSHSKDDLIKAGMEALAESIKNLQSQYGGLFAVTAQATTTAQAQSTAVKDSAQYYTEQIASLEKQRYTVAAGTEQWKSLTEQIINAKNKLSEVTDLTPPKDVLGGDLENIRKQDLKNIDDMLKEYQKASDNIDKIEQRNATSIISYQTQAYEKTQKLNEQSELNNATTEDEKVRIKEKYNIQELTDKEKLEEAKLMRQESEVKQELINEADKIAALKKIANIEGGMSEEDAEKQYQQDKISGEKVANDKIGELHASNNSLILQMQKQLALDIAQVHKNSEADDQKALATDLQNNLTKYQDYANKGISIVSSIFKAESDNRIADLQNQQAAQDEMYQDELNQAGLTAAQKKSITDQQKAYDKKIKDEIAQEKKNAWEAQHAADLLTAAANTAKAIIEALSGAPPPFNAVLAAITAGEAAVQTGIIASQTAPRFAFGTPSSGFVVPGGYNNDNYPVMVSSGERVTVQTPQQQQNQSSAGHTFNFHFNGNGWDKWSIIKSIQDVMRQMGVTDVNKAIKMNANTIQIGY